MKNFTAEALRHVHPSQISYTEMQQFIDAAIVEIEHLSKIEDAASRFINAIDVSGLPDERLGAEVAIRRALGWAS